LPAVSGQLADQFIVTSSLTKVYGLSGLRCGWIVAEPKLAQAMWRLNDLFGVIPAHLAERASVIALRELPRIAENVRARLDRNRALLHRFFDSRAELDVVREPYGTTAFPKLLRGTVAQMCAIAREKFETTVVPGEYFEMPDHFRIGIGGETGLLEEGLRRLGQALDDMMGTS
jgi:aspartate/methionine/tyrosine aminotransferase